MAKIGKIGRTGAAVLFAFTLVVVLIPCNRMGLNQGCVNQGEDCRKFAAIVCFLQRHMSWNSEHEPHLVMIGRPNGTQLGFAWPPYLIFNTPRKDGGWLMFRAGFRYDRNWHGYIFPTLAFKNVDAPLRY